MCMCQQSDAHDFVTHVTCIFCNFCYTHCDSPLEPNNYCGLVSGNNLHVCNNTMNGDKQTLPTQSLQSIYTLDIRMKTRGTLSNTQPIWFIILFA